ncbi:MAG: VTC domain-containing protein [bacterium]
MRLEYKFLVHDDALARLRADLMPFMHVDQHSQSRKVQEYTVRSIYFDTPKLDFYVEKIEGERVRKKLRIRGYNDRTAQSIVFLEIKRKYENSIAKDRSPLYFSDLDMFLRTSDVEQYVLSSNGHVGSALSAHRFLFNLKRRSLRPVVLVVYDREAFFCKFNGDLRITFDKNMRCLAFPTMNDLFIETDLTFSLRNHFVLEIKFYSGFPKWLQSIIEQHDLKRSALSKYTICLDAHRMIKRQHRMRTPLL